jgi:glycosyltransferase involved in cell wall biosynthesis
MMALPSAVDVIVPVYGPGPHLGRVVAVLRRQSPPVGRIIISHSGEGDPTPRFAKAPGVTVLHSRDRLFAGAARNRGLALAASDWVAFVDEDVIVEDDWHAILLKAIARRNADCIVGSIGYAASGGYWGMCVWFIEFGSVHPYLPARQVFGGASANLAVRHSALLSIGGFPEDWRMAEETLAQARLREKGHIVRFDPQLVGGHINLPGLRHMMLHLRVLGRHSSRLRREHPHLPGGTAVNLPVLSIGLWLVRLGQIYLRVLRAQNGPVLSLVLHTPGILLGLFAWNAGFISEAFRFVDRWSDY